MEPFDKYLQKILINMITSLAIYLLIISGWIIIIRKNWSWIKPAILEDDKKISIHVLKIILGLAVWICFVSLFIYLIITRLVFGIIYSESVYFYTFMGALGGLIGASGAVITGVIGKLKNKSANEQS